MPKLEIEHKFLIKMPDENMLRNLEKVRVLKISQTYTSEGSRARKIEEQGKVTYIITDLVRLDSEEEVSLGEYNRLLSLKEGNTIEKTRYVYPYHGKNIEIDIFPFWKSQAFLEVELRDEKDTFELPPFINVIREITNEKAYRNYALSKKIPLE